MSTTKPVPVSDLSGPALDWVVAGLEGKPREIVPTAENPSKFFTFAAGYSSDWSLAGPIIEREGIYLWRPYGSEGAWSAKLVDWSSDQVVHSDQPLIASMRCYVASRLGDTVQIPEELL
jgi:hypothetical protein